MCTKMFALGHIISNPSIYVTKTSPSLDKEVARITKVVARIMIVVAGRVPMPT